VIEGRRGPYEVLDEDEDEYYYTAEEYSSSEEDYETAEE
jgi:hypothetical protein